MRILKRGPELGVEEGQPDEIAGIQGYVDSIS
jgi:hypothetical protein